LSDWTGEISTDQQVTGAYELPGMEQRRTLLAGAQDARDAYNATRFDPASTAADRDAARQDYVAAVQELYSGTLPVVVDDAGNVSFQSVPLTVANPLPADPDRVARVDALSQRIATQPLDLLGRTLGRSPSPTAFRNRILGPQTTGAQPIVGDVVASMGVSPGAGEPSEPVTQPLVRPGLVAQREVRQLFADPDLFSPRIDLGTDRFLDPADVASLDVVDSLSIVEDVNERPRLVAQAVQALRQDPFRTMRENGADLQWVFRDPLGRTFVSLVENGAKATVAVLGGGPAGQVVLRPFNENLFKPAAEELVRPADPSVIADASTARLFRTDVPQPGVQDVTGRPFGFTLGQLQRPDGFPLTAGQPPLVAADGSVLRSPTRLQTMVRQGQRALVEGAADLVMASPVPIPGEDLVLGLRQGLDTPTLLGPDGAPLGGGSSRVRLFDARNEPIGARPAEGRVYVPSEFVVDPGIRQFYTDRRAPIAEVAEAFDLPTLGELSTSLPTDLVTSDVAVGDIRNTSEVNAAIRDLVPDEIRNTDWQVSSDPRVTLGQRLSGLRPGALPGTVRDALTTSGPGMTANAARRAGQSAVQTVIPQDSFLTRLCSDAITGCLRFGEVRLRQALAGSRADNRAARIDATDGFTDYTTGNALLSGLELLTPGSGTATPIAVGPADVAGLVAGGLVGLTPRVSWSTRSAAATPVRTVNGMQVSVGSIDVPEPGGTTALPPELSVTPGQETGSVVL
ncbi:MAG TPA: hypothetical protein VD813_14830, partial [Pseudonocardia sp.]|nr:hypothetical protein [Pseudonocardia sp.]